MSANRLFEIVYLLLERKQMTASELAERFEVSVRTIYRDIDTLSASGVPIFTTQGKGGGVALMEHFILDRAAFTVDEQRQLLTALQSLPENAKGAGETLAKLAGLFRRQETDWLQVNLSRWGSSEADSQKFERLKTAILDRHMIFFRYVSSYGQTTERRVFPARLVFKGQAWYLQGYCLVKKAFRTFKVSRILQLDDTGESFEAPLSPPPIEATDAPPPQFTVPLKLRFSPPMAYRVYDEFDESCVIHEASGTFLVTTAFPDDGWLYSYLLSFGTSVEVLEPSTVRRRLSLLAKEMWLAHSEPDRGCQVTSRIMETSKRQEVPHMDLNNQKFCQSCGMPLSSDVLGTETDGRASEHYCKYCYENGAFTASMTMEEMIDFCVPMMVQSTPGLTAEAARDQMMKFFPMLLRWKQN